VRLQDVTLNGNGINLKATGTPQSGIVTDVTANLAQLPIEGVSLGGDATIHAKVRGPIEKPVVDGTIETVNATAKTPQMTAPLAFVANVDFTQNQFNIWALRADIAGGTVDVQGQGSIRGPAALTLRANSIHPETWLSDRMVTGTVSAEATATLGSAALKDAMGSLSVDQFDIMVRDTPLRQVEPIRLSLNSETLTVDSLQLEGADTKAVVRGSANLRTGDLSLDLNGDTNLRILEAVLPDSSVTGTLRSEATVRGTTRQPSISGFVEVADTQFQIAEPPVELTNFNARIDLLGDQLEIRQAEGSLNGGKFSAAGKSGFSSKGLRDSTLSLSADGVQLEYPEGFQSEIKSNLMLAASDQYTTIQGSVDIVNAQYREDIDLSQQLFSRIAGGSEDTPFNATPKGGWTRNVGLNITVQTPGLVTVSNNVADLDLTGTFQVRGNLRNPVVLGRAAVNEGGEIYFGAGIAKDEAAPLDRRDRYVINRGTIEFNNAVETEPIFDFEAVHELQAKDERYLITLSASGTATNLKTGFTSDPYLSEPDIVSMLLTGMTFEELQGAHLSAARPLLANYLTGQVSSFVDTAGTALGLDTVRIEPVSLASDDDISAKLTVGKNVTKDFNFTFSQNLKGARSQAWIAAYNPYRNFLVRAVNETDQREVRLELRQDLKIGGGPALPRRTEPRSEFALGEITFTGNSLPARDLQRQVTSPGKPFNAYRMNNDVKKLESFYTKKNFLDVKVRGRRFADSQNRRIDVEYSILEGAEVMLAFEGAAVPGKVQSEARKLWIQQLSDGPSIRAVESHLLEYFRNKGFLKARVTHRDDSDSSIRRLVFVIDTGMKYQSPDWHFQGVDPINISQTAGEVLAAPDKVRRRIEFNLRRKGFLAAKSTVPQLVFDGPKPHFTVSVEPGPQYYVARMDIRGNNFFDTSHLRGVIETGATKILPKDKAGTPPEQEKPLKPFPFTSDWIDSARQRLSAEYWQQGFNDLHITPSSTWDASSPQLTASFSIDEGVRQLVDQVHVDGAMRTDSAYIARQLEIHPGDPVDYARINLTRKNLYDTGLFKRVEINVTPDDGGYAANVHLNENAPWRFRYGFTAANRLETSDRELGVTADLSYGNLFGRGIHIGTSVKAQQQERDARAFISFPEFFGKKITTTGTLFRTRDRTIPETTQYFMGMTAQQQWRLSDYYILTYDYTYQRVHALGPNANPVDPTVTDFPYHISRVNISISRDTRDDILNATRGNFLSNSFEFAPPGLGSTFKYVKNFIQYFRYREIRKNLVWASGYRAGLAKGLGAADLVPAEQFVTGGATTLRGFRQDRLTLEPGNGLLIMNQELRFPIFWRFAGAAFFDVGNIYHDIKSERPWDLRYSPGFGIRIKTPLILVRVDVGLNLSTRAGEPPRRIVFGIGQAF
jgi:outer membrane protein assembly factor BamA